MKISDYIVKYFISNNVKHVFGYPGGMVTHLMHSLGENRDSIETHINYHEQAAAFAACGYAQASGNVGVTFATSGPGATNLLTGIGHAYFDSIPTVFITGQVNTFESKGDSSIRQKGFQETDIVSMAKPITKAAFYVDNAEELPFLLNHAFQIAMENRKGPVLLDIPMDVFRTQIPDNTVIGFAKCEVNTDEVATMAFQNKLIELLDHSNRPCILIGNGIKIDNQVDNIREILKRCPMPVVSSMLAVDVITEDQGLEGVYYGFVGAYGNRTANFTVAKCDLLICLGTRLDIRQVGGAREKFAPNAKIVRIDIDANELNNKIREDEEQFTISLSVAIPILRNILSKYNNFDEWISVCKEIKNQIKYTDEKEPNKYINEVSRIVPDDFSVTADVGQNMVWTAQSFKLKSNQRVYFSGGMGAMGFSLPAAIGIYYATGKPVICINGDGGLQMNIQEFQFLVRENIPIKIFVMNNSSLGMIRHFQEMYFDSKYYFTVDGSGYDSPDFVKIANGYGIESHLIENMEYIKKIRFSNGPELFDIRLENSTVLTPKLEYGKPNQDQEPLLDRKLYNYLMEL